ncbi:cytochrome c-type biogenesis protein CcmH [Halomonas campisalis]|uniref:Cytochrome c-type biogenesis protein n=1 Tax=Billgrantia campisalis TaxID=74661 RepID=A0ABS9P4Y9_9GAMM|nr:cytochrome c-type biogenesis protein [Halomonas campisalis]MCG6656829.1 cytochrome c-type biogenesis protein CcmH [Halomonas campisalis]MDR5862018.1 cytochrome c-type biogenesis protein CcmH [Halomonas campisalis]
MSHCPHQPLRRLPLWLAALVAWLLPAGLAMAVAIGEPIEFETEAQQRQYQTLVRELRCTVCQSETIHESNAELAADMRRRVYQMTLDGHDGDAIVDFMVARYGDYVRYRPPVQANTAVLWASPFLLALIGAGFWWQIIRGRRQMAQRPEFTEQERAALKRLNRGE